MKSITYTAYIMCLLIAMLLASTNKYVIANYFLGLSILFKLELLSDKLKETR